MIDLIKEYDSMTDAEKAYYWVVKYYENARKETDYARKIYRESGKSTRSKEYHKYEMASQSMLELRRLKNKIAFELDKGNRKLDAFGKPMAFEEELTS